jgi:intein-encoded DNA endonuclease-like protein
MKPRIRDTPLKEKLRLYEEAMRLRKERGWGYVRIGRNISVPPDVVRHWIHHGRNPARHGRTHMFEVKPSPELAYIIGVCQGDADLPQDNRRTETKGQKIRLRAIDKDSVEAFASVAASVLGKEKPFVIGKEKESYRAVINSYHLHNFLKKPFDELKPFIEAHPDMFIGGGG